MTSASPPSDISFDVAPGYTETLYSGVVTPDVAVFCDFTVEEFFFEEDLRPIVSIIFSSTNQNNVADYEHMARLSATRSEDDKGWTHWFTLKGPNGRASEVVAFTGQTDSTLPMRLARDRRGYVVYYVGKENYEGSSFDVLDVPLSAWKVVASGVAGSATCTCPDFEDEVSKWATPCGNE